MEFSELVRARRSIRRYQEKPVPKELLRELLETACWAPSGDNRQPWYFLALTDPQEIDRLKGTMERVSVEIEEHLEGIFQGKHPEVVREEQRFLGDGSKLLFDVIDYLIERGVIDIIADADGVFFLCISVLFAAGGKAGNCEHKCEYKCDYLFHCISSFR